MIVFDLQCANGHTFEGWFDSSEAFEEQSLGGMIVCPVCEDTNVKRVLSPVKVNRSQSSDTVPAGGDVDYGRLAREVISYMQKNFEDVGSNFASEALKIHYGVKDKRNIKGSATDEEEKMLKDEGVEFFKIPVPVKKDKKEN